MIKTIIPVKKELKDYKVTIGADPELFLKDGRGNLVPAFFYIKGTKDSPEPISGNGHAIQFDNVMAEYNIPACKTEDEFVEANKFVLNYIEETICKPNDLTLSITASEHLGEEYLSNETANTFGCSPDFNAYTLEQNTFSRPNQTSRSAGAHLHCSYPGLNYDKAMKLIKAMDLLISVPLVILEPSSERKLLYGKAGSHRFKEVSNDLCIIEYRSPSNFWLTSETMMRFVYQQIIKAVEFVETEQIITNELDIINAINDNDGSKALEILGDYNIDLDDSLIEELDYFKENPTSKRVVLLGKNELVSEEDLSKENIEHTWDDNDSLGG